MLVSKCPYFRGSLTDAFPEGRNNEVYLSEDVPEAFSWFFTWLYSGVVNKIETKQDARIAFETYLMADRLIMVVLKNDLMDAVRRYHARIWMGVELLELLAKHEGFEGELKRFGLDQIAYDLHQRCGKKKLNPYMPSNSFCSAINAFLAEGSSTAINTFWAVWVILSLFPYH